MGFRRKARKLALVVTLVATMAMGSVASTSVLLAGISTSPSGRAVTVQVTEEYPFIATTTVKDSHDRYANIAGISTSPSDSVPAITDVATGESAGRRSHGSFTL